jgi:hypothetical protein
MYKCQMIKDGTYYSKAAENLIMTLESETSVKNGREDIYLKKKRTSR